MDRKGFPIKETLTGPIRETYLDLFSVHSDAMAILALNSGGLEKDLPAARRVARKRENLLGAYGAS